MSEDQEADQLNAQHMLRHSLIYLFSSYRDQGYSAEEARGYVAKEIDSAAQEYQEKNIVNKTHGIVNPHSKTKRIQTLADGALQKYNSGQPIRSDLREVIKQLQSLETMLNR